MSSTLIHYSYYPSTNDNENRVHLLSIHYFLENILMFYVIILFNPDSIAIS